MWAESAESEHTAVPIRDDDRLRAWTIESGLAGRNIFQGFARGRLTVRQPGLRASLGKCPFIAAVRVDQQEFDRRAASPIAHRRDLQRQRFRNARSTHEASLL